jgi:DNA-binding beta-propeller fold protein YncE
MLSAAGDALAKGPFVLATGRRDPRIYAIDLRAALAPPNDNTPNAIVSRSLVSPARLDGTLLGDPANIVLSDDQRTAFVMNHHGAVANAEFVQHGGRASVAVMDVGKMLKREYDNTDRALEHDFDAGWFGGVGLLVLPRLIVAGYSETWLSEDGSNRIGLIDRRTGGLVGQIQMALTGPGTRQLTSPCPNFPVPFVSPTPPPVVPFLSLDLAFGCWPDPEGLALGIGSDGKTYLFSGNGGTEDVSVMNLEAALAGEPVVEVAPRIPVQSGPFGIKASPDGKHIAVTSRESNRVDFEGNTISIIDVDLAPGASRAPRRASASARAIPPPARGPSRSPGRPTARASSWRTSAPTTSPSSTWGSRSRTARRPKWRGSHSPAPTASRPAPKAPASPPMVGTRSSRAGRASRRPPPRAEPCSSSTCTRASRSRP